MKIGTNLRKFRKDRGLGQADIAVAAGVASSTVSEWEKCKYNPELSKIIALANEFNVSLDSIVFPERESKNSISKDELELIERYRKAPLKIRESIRMILS